MRSITARLARGALVLAAGVGSANAQPSAELAIGGLVTHAAVLRADALAAACTPRVVEDRRIVESGGRREERSVRWGGCLLRDLLDRAKPVERGRGDLRTLVVVATATDGYRALFSWAELWNSPIGDHVLVITERDGRPLADDEGRFALRSFHDTRPGPRHVRQLRAIDVVRVAP